MEDRSGIVGTGAAALKKFSTDRASRLAAALSYYTVFAVAPLIVVVVSVAGLVYGDQAARGEIVARIEGTVGADSAAFIQGMVADAGSGGGATGGVVIGMIVALFGASVLAVQLRRAFNVVWDVPYEETRGILGFIRGRVAGAVTVVGIGLLLIAVLTANSVVAGAGERLSSEASYLRPLVEVVNPIVSLALAAIAFALLFKYLPAVPVGWREAVVGGAVTSVLFTVGSWILSRYLGSGNVAAGFGAASALVVLLVFIYYSAQIVLFGAEFARAYGIRRQELQTVRTIPPGAEAAVAPGVKGIPPSRSPGPAVRDAPAWAVAAFLAGLAIGLLRRPK